MNKLNPTTFAHDSPSDAAEPTRQPTKIGERKVPRPDKRRGGAWMSRTVVNFWLDALLLVTVLVLVWSSTVIRFVFPTAASANQWTLWGGTLDHWIGFQFGVVAFFTFLVVIHVMLHWTWVCGVVTARFLPKQRSGKTALDDGVRTLYGVGLLIVLLHLLGFAIAAAVLMIQGPV